VLVRVSDGSRCPSECWLNGEAAGSANLARMAASSFGGMTGTISLFRDHYVAHSQGSRYDDDVRNRAGSWRMDERVASRRCADSVL